MVRTDVMQRGDSVDGDDAGGGAGWTADLNLGWRHRLSAVLVVGIVATLMSSILGARVLGHWRRLMLILFLFLVQKEFYMFLGRRRGWWFVLRCLPLHMLYYCYSLVAVAAGVLVHFIKRKNGSSGLKMLNAKTQRRGEHL